MNLTRAAASAVLILRVSYGLALIATPRRLALRCDVVATAAERRRLPPGSPLATLAVGGGSALVTLLLAGAVEE